MGIGQSMTIRKVNKMTTKEVKEAGIRYELSEIGEGILFVVGIVGVCLEDSILMLCMGIGGKSSLGGVIILGSNFAWILLLFGYRGYMSSRVTTRQMRRAVNTALPTLPTVMRKDLIGREKRLIYKEDIFLIALYRIKVLGYLYSELHSEYRLDLEEDMKIVSSIDRVKNSYTVEGITSAICEYLSSGNQFPATLPPRGKGIWRISDREVANMVSSLSEVLEDLKKFPRNIFLPGGTKLGDNVLSTFSSHLEEILQNNSVDSKTREQIKSFVKFATTWGDCPAVVVNFADDIRWLYKEIDG